MPLKKLERKFIPTESMNRLIEIRRVSSQAAAKTNPTMPGNHQDQRRVRKIRVGDKYLDVLADAQPNNGGFIMMAA